MSFQKGDKVRWASGNENPEGLLVDGPFFLHGRAAATWPSFDWGPAWVVLFPSMPDAKLIGEAALESLEGWVDCPGEHRLTEAKDVAGAPSWERRDNPPIT